MFRARQFNATKRRLHEIRRLLDALAQVVKPQAIGPWLKERNRAFENMTPLQVIEVGEIDRLWQMVHHMGGRCRLIDDRALGRNVRIDLKIRQPGLRLGTLILPQRMGVVLEQVK